uniref:Uncharacterized protein n=2 Tax=Plectus sambesii TaxID=2011161 RepID=A0A914UJR7_9BILA
MNIILSAEVEFPPHPPTNSTMTPLSERVVIGIIGMLICLFVFLIITYLCAFANYDRCYCCAAKRRRRGSTRGNTDMQEAQMFVNFNPGSALTRAWNIGGEVSIL